jgi:ABC-type transport system involved in cytochrome bd biosynthesis fused ATPase/permease subunit
LETPDEEEAERLTDQMNEILADANLHSILRQREAERRFDPLVVAAFYEGLDADAADPEKVRDKEIAIPGGVPRVLLAGVTGSGKTSLLRQLMGFDPRTDRFPSTSTARTTTCDMEVIAAAGVQSTKRS